MAAQQARFEDRRAAFNGDQPHDALCGAVPANRLLGLLDERTCKLSA